MKKRWYGISRLIMALAVVAIFATPGAAFNFEFGEVSGALDVTLGYALAGRTQEGKTSDPTRPNSKAEWTFRDKGLFSQVFKTSGDFSAAWRNYGIISNATYSYDTFIMNRNTDRLGTPVDTGLGDSWSDGAREASGSVFTLLDAYGYGTFIDDTIEVRVGKQVINWGEGLFYLDGVAVQSTLNINNAVLPGAELKELFLGLPAVYGQWAVNDNLSLEAYYQWDWEKAQFPGVGTFYGDNLLGPGGQEEWIPAVRGADIDPDSSGQYGLAMRYILGDVEMGLYYSRYHDKLPLISVDLNTGLVQQTYLEDSDMVGASFATTLGDWSFNGEVAYSPDRRISTNFANGEFNGDGINSLDAWEEHNTVHTSIHGLWLGGPLFLGIDSQFVALQTGVDYIDGNTDRLAPQLDLNLDPTITADNWAYGVAGEWDGTWQAVMPSVDVTLLLFAQYDIDGNSHIWGNFAEKRLLTSSTVNVNHGNDWEYGVTYAYKNYGRSTIDNQDSVNLFVNYKF